jgi:hypothetical protein
MVALFRRDRDDETRMVLSQNGGVGEEGRIVLPVPSGFFLDRSG